MSTLRLTASRDLYLGTNAAGKKTLVITKDVAECAAIKLDLRFRFHEGEWYMDTRQGVPYQRYILVKNPDLNVIRNIVAKIVLSVPSIKSVTNIELGVDPKTREADISFEAVADSGAKISGGVGKPFLINGLDVARNLETTEQ